MNRFRRLLPLSIVLLACLGIVGGTSVFAHGVVHHTPHHHPKNNPPTHTTVVSTHPPPACFPTPGNVQTTVSVKCVNFAGFTPPFALGVTPDCAALVVTDGSTGQVVQRTSGGVWVLPMPTTGTLSFSLDGSGCANGTYQFSVDQPAGGGHTTSFSYTF